MTRTVAGFKRLSPVYKAVVGLVAPVGTIIATLLALNVISPFGEDAFAAAGDQPFVATAWIDASDLIRRLEVVAEKGPTPFTMTMDFSDFGKDVDVRPPDQADVQELSDLLERLS